MILQFLRGKWHKVRQRAADVVDTSGKTDRGDLIEFDQTGGVYTLQIYFDRDRVDRIERFMGDRQLETVNLGVTWQPGDSVTLYNITRIARSHDLDNGLFAIRVDDKAPKGFATW